MKRRIQLIAGCAALALIGYCASRWLNRWVADSSVIDQYMNSQVGPTEVRLSRAFLAAIEARDTAAVQAFLRKGLDADHPSEIGTSVLHQAAAKGYIDVARVLVEFGADVNRPGLDGASPLQIAVLSRQTAMVQYLLTKGASVDQADNDGRTALIDAATIGDADTVRLLLQHGANVKYTDPYGRSAIQHARSDEIRRLLEAAAVPE